MDEANSFLTVEEVAKKFGTSPATIYRLLQKGELPAFKVGNQWRFSLKRLEAWVANQINSKKLKPGRKKKWRKLWKPNSNF